MNMICSAASKLNEKANRKKLNSEKLSIYDFCLSLMLADFTENKIKIQSSSHLRLTSLFIIF